MNFFTVTLFIFQKQINLWNYTKETWLQPQWPFSMKLRLLELFSFLLCFAAFPSTSISTCNANTTHVLQRLIPYTSGPRYRMTFVSKVHDGLVLNKNGCLRVNIQPILKTEQAFFSQKKCVINVVISRTAATNLPEVRTLKRKMKILLLLLKNNFCHAKPKTETDSCRTQHVHWHDYNGDLGSPGVRQVPAYTRYVDWSKVHHVQGTTVSPIYYL